MRKTWLRAAELAGDAVRGLGRTWPGIGGAACVCVGLGLMYVPLAFLAAGLFLLVLDNRRP